MTKIEIWLLAVGLAMACFSIASGILLKRTLWRPMLTMAFFFGLFQALMPLIGWACASTFSHLIEDVDHWIAFGILAFLGGRMVRESFKEEECRHDFDPPAGHPHAGRGHKHRRPGCGRFVRLPGYEERVGHPALRGHHRLRVVRPVAGGTPVRHPLRVRHRPTPEG